VRWRAPAIVQLPCALWASRPQLKRDPLGGDGNLSMIRRLSTLVSILALACTRGERSQPSRSRDGVNSSTSGTAAQSSSDASEQHCSSARKPVQVSEDSIGPLDLSTNLRGLKALCPPAHDTMWYGHESAGPGVVFPFEGLTVLAVQHEDSLLLDQPADEWNVRGADALLLDRFLLTAAWGDFRTVMGRGIASGAGPTVGENRIAVMFCAHPRLFFVLEASPDSVPQRSDLSHIPADARIIQINIFPRPNATWSC